jgi:hypothetical protein
MEIERAGGCRVRRWREQKIPRYGDRESWRSQSKIVWREQKIARNGDRESRRS